MMPSYWFYLWFRLSLGWWLAQSLAMGKCPLSDGMTDSRIRTDTFFQKSWNSKSQIATTPSDSPAKFTGILVSSHGARSSSSIPRLMRNVISLVVDLSTRSVCPMELSSSSSQCRDGMLLAIALGRKCVLLSWEEIVESQPESVLSVFSLVRVEGETRGTASPRLWSFRWSGILCDSRASVLMQECSFYSKESMSQGRSVDWEWVLLIPEWSELFCSVS